MCECLRKIFRVTWTSSSSTGQDDVHDIFLGSLLVSPLLLTKNQSQAVVQQHTMLGSLKCVPRLDTFSYILNDLVAKVQPVVNFPMFIECLFLIYFIIKTKKINASIIMLKCLLW